MLILFLSTPLFCYYDRSLPEITYESQLTVNKIQDSFIILLWNYLLHRYGYLGAARTFSNLICIYLQMQRVSRSINHEVRTRNDLKSLNQALNQAIAFENETS